MPSAPQDWLEVDRPADPETTPGYHIQHMELHQKADGQLVPDPELVAYYPYYNRVRVHNIVQVTKDCRFYFLLML